MADSILKLKVSSEEYDAKLKKAVEGIRHLAEVAHRGAGELTGLDQAELDYVRSLGEMETKSRTAAGSVRELESAYKELKVVYDNLNNVEKNDEAGKALAASLDRIKERAQEARAQLDSASRSLQDNGQIAQQAGGSLGSLNDIFGMSITKLAGWGTAIAAAKGALDVAKDAFMQSETNIDDWGRTVEGAKGAYDVFLNTLNNGNWSNFFTNLTTAIKGAMDLYDALDRLGSIKSNNQAAIAIVQAEIQQLRVLKQQGKDVDDQIKQATQRLKTLQSQSVEAGKTAGTISMREVIRNEANSIKGGAQVSDRSINAAIEGIVRKGQAEFDKYRKNVEVFEKNPRFQSEVAVNYTTSAGTQTTYVKQFDINKLTEEQQRQYKLSKAITEGETRIQEGISIYAQAVQEGAQSAREEFRGNRYALQGNGTRSGSGKAATGKTDTELKQNEAAVAKLTEEYQKLATDAKTANDAQLSGIKERQSAIQTEIANLKARNEELKKFADEAQGLQVNIGMNSSLPDLTAKLKELQAAQSQALNGTEWQEYQKQIEQVNLQIDAMKGKWKDGMKATISVNTEAIQKAIGESSKLQDLITKPKKQTSSATVGSNANHVASDASKLEDVITKPKKGTATIDSNIKELAADASNLEDVITKPKKGKVTIESNTEQVAADASKLEDVITKPKTGKVTITADTTDAKAKIGEVDAMIGDKKLTVTALTDEAEDALSNIEGLTLQSKELDITADVQKVLDAITQIDGVTVDPKTLEITAGTAEAYAKLQELFANIEGTTVTFNVEPKQIEMSTGISITTQSGMNAYISQLKSDLANADLGSELYNSIAAKLTDMTSLSNLVSESLKAGLGTALFDAADILGEDFWTRAMEGGVEDIDWQGIVDKINEKLQEMDLKPISLDFKTGNVDGGKDEKGNEQKGANGIKQIVGNISTITGALQQLGVDVPEGFQKTLGVMQVITTILMALQSLSTITATSSALKSIPIIGMFLHNGGVVHAANGYSVPGNTFSGDQVPAMLDSGELVLNKAAQGNLLTQLDNANNGNVVAGETRVEADEMVLLLRNGAARKGVTIGDYLGL